jgi:hypothetical protein
VGTGGNSHEAHTHRYGGGVSSGRSDRHGANDAPRHATIILLDNAKHYGDDASNAGRPAIDHHVAEHDKHDANAERWFANNHDEQQHDDDRAGRLPHTQSGRRTMCVPLRSDARWNLDGRRGERSQYLRASRLVQRLASGCLNAAIRFFNAQWTPRAGTRCGW